MWRRLEDTGRMALGLRMAAMVLAEDRGDRAAARPLLKEALTVARHALDRCEVRGDLARVELRDDNPAEALELLAEASALAHDMGSRFHTVGIQDDRAWALRAIGRIEEAKAQIRVLVPRVLELDEPAHLSELAEHYAVIAAEAGNVDFAVRLLGACDAMRERQGTPRSLSSEQDLAPAVTSTRNLLPPAQWQHNYDAGRGMTVEDVITESLTSTTPSRDGSGLRATR